MMLFIPLTEGAHTAPEYREKILFNHDKFNGEKAAVCIGGLQNLNTEVKLKNGTLISLQSLLKGFPASQGMSRPLLFQHVEQNSSGIVAMAVYQKADQLHIDKRKTSLEAEIRQVIVPGEEINVFIKNEEGVWFGSVYKMKGGKVISSQQPTKEGVDYANRINKLLSSPPKKRQNFPITPRIRTRNHQSATTQLAQNEPQTSSPKAWYLNSSQMVTRDIVKETQQAITPFFLKVEEAFGKQNAINETFNKRIGNLEETTEGIDRKIDILLQKFTPPSLSRKAQKTTENMSCEPVDRLSSLGHSMTGATKQNEYHV